MLLHCQNLLIAFHPILMKTWNFNHHLLAYRALWYLAPYLLNIISFTLPLTTVDPDLQPFFIFHKVTIFVPTRGKGELCISLSTDFCKASFLTLMKYLLMWLFKKDFFLTNKSKLVTSPNNILSYHTFILSSAHTILLKVTYSFMCSFFILPTRQRKYQSLELFLPISIYMFYFC